MLHWSEAMLQYCTTFGFAPFIESLKVVDYEMSDKPNSYTALSVAQALFRAERLR